MELLSVVLGFLSVLLAGGVVWFIGFLIEDVWQKDLLADNLTHFITGLIVVMSGFLVLWMVLGMSMAINEVIAK